MTTIEFNQFELALLGGAVAFQISTLKKEQCNYPTDACYDLFIHALENVGKKVDNA